MGGVMIANADVVWNTSLTPKSKSINHNSFDDDWQKHINVKFTCWGTAQYVQATVGYDTFLINEDFMTAVGGTPLGWSGCGTVVNSKGKKSWTNWQANGRVSGYEDVRHTGSGVKYNFAIKYRQ